MRVRGGLAAWCTAVLAFVGCVESACAQEQPSPFHTVQTDKGPMADNPDADECYEYVLISTTKGDFIVELHRCAAPDTVANFLKYIDEGFYDDTLFHRVEHGFVIQGGGYVLDPDAPQTGDSPPIKEKPGHPPIKSEWPNGLKNVKGTIAMARGVDPNSATSQFFVNLRDSSNLDNQSKGGAGFCVFGRVVEGMDVVEQIGVVQTIRKPDIGNIQSPIDPVQIIQVGRVPDEEAKKLAETHRQDRTDMARAGFGLRSEIYWKLDNRERNKKMTDDERMAQAMEYVKKQGWDVTKGVKLPSGVWYIDDVVGVGDSPKPDDWVAMKWDGWLTWGEKFGSWQDLKGPIKGPLSGFVPGYQDAVRTMKPGGVRVFIIPAPLAYGDVGREPKIPANSALIYRVQLLEVLPGATQLPVTPLEPAKAPEESAKPPASKGQ